VHVIEEQRYRLARRELVDEAADRPRDAMALDALRRPHPADARDRRQGDREVRQAILAEHRERAVAELRHGVALATTRNASLCVCRRAVLRQRDATGTVAG
jgi:hypothetical protein